MKTQWFGDGDDEDDNGTTPASEPIPETGNYDHGDEIGTLTGDHESGDDLAL